MCKFDSSLGSGGIWRAVWAVGIQGGCTFQTFLLNSIFGIWGLMEGHLGHGDPGQLYLPAVPPQLHLWDLAAYGRPSGLQGSRATIPASRSSSTPSLGSRGINGGHHHHSLECCSCWEPCKAPRQCKKVNGWGGMWRGVMRPKMHIIFFLFGHYSCLPYCKAHLYFDSEIKSLSCEHHISLSSGWNHLVFCGSYSGKNRLVHQHNKCAKISLQKSGLLGILLLLANSIPDKQLIGNI